MLLSDIGIADYIVDTSPYVMGKLVSVSGHFIYSKVLPKDKMEISVFKIDNSTFDKVSGIHFDDRLTFHYHM